MLSASLLSGLSGHNRLVVVCTVSVSEPRINLITLPGLTTARDCVPAGTQPLPAAHLNQGPGSSVSGKTAAGDVASAQRTAPQAMAQTARKMDRKTTP